MIIRAPEHIRCEMAYKESMKEAKSNPIKESYASYIMRGVETGHDGDWTVARWVEMSTTRTIIHGPWATGA